MKTYLCILFRRTDVLKAETFEQPDDRAAIGHALELCRPIPYCTGFELWHRGEKVHDYARPRVV